MRTSALAILLAASASAATYTNNLGSTEPALQLIYNGQGYTQSAIGAYDSSIPFSFETGVSSKPWATTVSDGSFSANGETSLPSSYIATQPFLSNYGYRPLFANVAFEGVPAFRLGDLSGVSLQVTFNPNNTAKEDFMIFVEDTNGLYYQLNNGSNSSLVTTRTGPGNTGDYIFTYSNITVSDLNQDLDRTPFLATDQFTKLMFMSNAHFNQETYNVVPGQILDVTFQSASITLSGAPIPEPSTYGLILGGLALAGAAIRRRRK